MGIIFSRFRKKKSTLETLEKLQNEIKEMEENRSWAQMRLRRITKTFFVSFIFFAIFCTIVIYFQSSSPLKNLSRFWLPLALSSLVLYLFNKIATWYYIRLMNRNQTKLIEMKKEKKRILEEVMDKETYRVAKEILDKYPFDPITRPNIQAQPAQISSDTLRRRLQGASPPLPVRPSSQNPGTAVRNMTPLQQQNRVMNFSPGPVKVMQGPPRPVLMPPAPILPLERSYVEKVVDYLIGDGPNNRYALVCSRCHSHNGMALKEEFEYISYKCCYCFFYNQARKSRPEAPRLDISQVNTNPNTDSENSANEFSDTDNKPKENMKSGTGAKHEGHEESDVSNSNLEIGNSQRDEESNDEMEIENRENSSRITEKESSPDGKSLKEE